MNIVQDVVIVGGGQAGLALGYYLKKSSLSFVILDANLKVGDSWRHRYDSLKLFTPRKFSGLPGLPFPGEPEGWPTKDEAAQYLHQYASQMDLPIELGVSVNRLIKEDIYAIHTNKGVIYSRNVVAATGPFQKS
ncbi:putative oxidoreductase CzcO [compost metagenome]